MDVIWTQEALDRLDDIEYYLAVEQQVPQAAKHLLSRIFDRAPQIAEMPLSGRMLPNSDDPNVREQLENPYRIIYLIEPEIIYILSVMHQRQLLPNMKEIKTFARLATQTTEE